MFQKVLLSWNRYTSKKTPKTFRGSKVKTQLTFINNQRKNKQNQKKKNQTCKLNKLNKDITLNIHLLK